MIPNSETGASKPTHRPFNATRNPLPDDVNTWLSLKSAAAKLDLSEDTILRRAINWCPERVPKRIRYKHLRLDDNTREERRYFERDLEAMLVIR
jgi:hypothetical protein